jgi:hypothetical protein
MARSAWAGLVLLAAAACGGDDDDGGPVPELARRAEEVRELELLQDVEVIHMTREQFAAEAAENVEDITDEVLDELAGTWGRLGYFSMDVDLRPIIAGSSSDWVGGFYSNSTNSITVVGEAPESTLVHEYVHALQDQHFDLSSYDVPTSDGFLARRAVVEGDATLAELRFVMQDFGGVDLQDADWAEILSTGRENGDDYLTSADYPVFFLDYPSFVYGFGLEYTAGNLMGVSIDQPVPAAPPYDWGLEDQLYTDRTVQQILRRDVDVDSIENVGLEVVPGPLTVRLEAIDWDTLGEWYTYLLFYPLEGSAEVPDARALAAGWDGDRVLFVRDVDGGEIATVWASAWDDEATATQVRIALAALYGRDPEPPEQAQAADGEPTWLQQLGNRVVVTKNLDPGLAPTMAGHALGSSTSSTVRRLRPPLGKQRLELLFP